MNLAKVQATEGYLLNSDHIFVVGEIGRAVTDRSLRSNVFAALKQHIPYEWEKKGLSQLNVTIVCTHSEVCCCSPFAICGD